MKFRISYVDIESYDGSLHYYHLEHYNSLCDNPTCCHCGYWHDLGYYKTLRTAKEAGKRIKIEDERCRKIAKGPKPISGVPYEFEL